MPSPTVASTLGLVFLLVKPATGLAAWWTWPSDALTPHFAYQDPGSGDILHSSCSSNGTAVFPTDNPHKFPIKTRPKPATPLVVTGWWDDELETPIASIFYQSADDSIVNGYFTCDLETGEYTLDPEGETIVSDEAGAPSVHDRTGLAIAELGDAGGYRIYYHDEDGLVNLLAYDDDTDWRYLGPVSRKRPAGMSLSAVQTKDTNVSVAYPYDGDNIAVAHFNEANRNKWSLTSFPTPFDSPTPTNRTDPSDMLLDSSGGESIALSSFDDTAVHLGITANTEAELSVFYIGQDSQLHRLSQADGAWEAVESPGETQWPEADEQSGPLAVVSVLETNEMWVYYSSGGGVMELHMDEGGTWAEAKKPSTGNNTDAASESGSNDPQSTETSGEDGATSTDTSADGQETESTEEPAAGISSGAKAGIGVGVAAGVLALAAAGFFLVRRRRQTATEDGKGSTAELGTPASYHAVTELAGRDTERPQELPSSSQKYELLGDTGHRTWT
ncbi:hypothetical protein F66182_270 [Fusarium sp. NRRL 66182]|nr:hypothetical protein F66182_270 [Fusarium sp. NRRL 66182]